MRHPRQFMIRSLMIAAAIVAVLLAVLRFPGLLVGVGPLLYLAVVVMLGYDSRGFPDLSKSCSWVVASSTNCVCAALCMYVCIYRQRVAVVTVTRALKPSVREGRR